VKVYLDTNVLIAAFATRGLCADLLRLVLPEHQLVIGEAGLTETRRVLQKKLRIPAEAAAEVEAFLRQQATVVAPSAPLKVKLPDEGDVVILTDAVAGGAEVLVTGDRDLLAIAARAPLPILAPRGLWELLRTNPGGE
jgi:uncharacterized protein